MEGSSVFNPGFLGNGFNWWIGQIPADGTWRDNIEPGIYKEKDTNRGWGYRYKVRIIGLHDQGQDSIPDKHLPWANVMYPISGGGYQALAGSTPALRQGNMVFGFFADGPDMQVPVIMGVLGNNSQSILSQKMGDNRVTNTQPGSLASSGYSSGPNPKTGTAAGDNQPGDGDIGTSKPKTQEVAQSTAPASAKQGLDAYGLPEGRPYDKWTLENIAELSNIATDKGLKGDAFSAFIKDNLAQRIATRKAEAESPNSKVQPGATIESEAVHLLDAGRVKASKIRRECIVTMKPDDFVGSAITAIQTAIDNLANEIDGYLSTISSYIDMVGGYLNALNDMKSMLGKIACEIAKYMKIIMDKVMEYVLKILNKSLTRVVAAMPSSFRHMFGDMKEIITGLILCLYNKLTNNICALLQKLLEDAFPLDDLTDQAVENAKDNDTRERRRAPKVPLCYAEDLVGKAIAQHRDEINDANQSILDNVNTFIDDIQSQIAGVSGKLSDITSLLGNISGSIGSALSFENLSLTIFGCELKPNPALADCYTFGTGEKGKSDANPVNTQNVGKTASTSSPTAEEAPDTDFKQPTQAQSNLSESRRRTAARNNRVGNRVGDVAAPGDDIDDEVARSRAGDRSGLDDALDIF